LKHENQHHRGGLEAKDWIVIVGGLVIVASLLAFVGVRVREPRAVVKEMGQAPPAKAPVTNTRPEHVQEPELQHIQRITVAELRQRLDRGEAAVVDVRGIEDYRAGHIPGALQIPLSFIEGEVSYLPRDKMIVAYCT
jgi:hypothetical protein